MLSNILLPRLSTYIDEIIGDHQCGFQRNRSTIDQIFCIHQILEKKWEYNETVCQLFVDFKKAYDTVACRLGAHCYSTVTLPISGSTANDWTFTQQREVHLLDRCLGILLTERCLGNLPTNRTTLPQQSNALNSNRTVGSSVFYWVSPGL
jgi:hypothetical protein